MALTDAKIKAAKLENGKKVQKLADSGGLYLLINKSGKYWRLKYRYGGKEKTLSIGTYPEIKLKKAREARDSAKKLLKKHIDPNQAKQNAKQKQFEKAKADTFESVAMEWLEKHKVKWVESTYKGHQVRLAKHILPWLGSLPIQDIKPFDVLSVCLKIEKKGHAELARRVLNICSQVFRYGVASCRVESDPTRDLKGALAPTVTKNRARLTDPKEVGALMRAIQGFNGTHVVACALQLSPYVFLRPGELRKLEWRFVDFEAAQIVIPSEYMKMKQKHIVPLAKQAVAILKDVQALTGQGKYVFPSIRNPSRPMSENTINVSLQRLGYDTSNQHCAHGFRGTASTLLNELGFNADYVESQLAHKVGNDVRGAYNHAQYLEQRKAMMQQWADYLDGLRDGATVVPIHRAQV